VSTVMGSYVFATTESMKKAVNGMDRLRPKWSYQPYPYPLRSRDLISLSHHRLRQPLKK
jgi:hypothetical protein